MTKRSPPRGRPGERKTAPRYSGKNGEAFWARINAIAGKEWNAAYTMGCALQDLEGHVLQYLDEINPHRRRARR